MRLAGALLMIWIALGVPAFAQQAPAVGLRVGSHPTYGRVVMDWPEAVTYRAEESGNRLILRFDAPARYDLSGALRLPKNVESLSAIDGGIALQAPPGTRFRHYRLGNRVVIDVLDGTEAGLYLLDGNPGWSFWQIACALNQAMASGLEVRESKDFRWNNRMVDKNMPISAITAVLDHPTPAER